MHLLRGRDPSPLGAKARARGGLEHIALSPNPVAHLCMGLVGISHDKYRYTRAYPNTQHFPQKLK